MTSLSRRSFRRGAPRLSSVALALVLAACGGGGGSTPALQQPQAAVAGPVFTKTRASYAIAKTGGGYTVTDIATGQQTAASAAQLLTFSDVTVNLDIATQAATLPAAERQMLTELYVAFFNRVPEADGLNFWIEQRRSGQSINAIADAFYAAAIQYGDITGYTPTMTNADFVNIIYRNVLGRTSADAEGLAYWSNALAAGKETRGTLVSSILNSAHTFKGDPTWGWVPDLLDNKLAVATAFAITYGLNYKDATTSISRTMQIAAAVTSTSTSAALQQVTAVVGTNSGGGGTSSGVATYDEASIPNFDPTSSGVTDFVVTNRGLYMKFLDGDTHRILKLHGNPIFNDWTVVPFANGISGFAPLNVYSEADREVSFYWHQVGIGARWGLYTANTGVPGFDVEDDIGIDRVAAGGTSGIVATRPWVVASKVGDERYLYQDDGVYTGVRKTSDYFGTSAGTEIMPELSGAVLVAHPSDGTMFVGVGNKLHVFMASGRQSTVTLPEGNGASGIADMFWHDNALYFSYGSKIYRRTGSGVSEFTTLTGIAGTLAELFPAPGRFCLNGGDVITADGMARRISDGYTRSWLSSGTLTTAQQQQLALVQSQVAGAGVWCSPNNLARIVYTVDLAAGKVRMFNAMN